MTRADACNVVLTVTAVATGVSDGYYKTCSQRPQPYALAVTGPLLMRKADSLVYPPTFTAYQVPPVSPLPPAPHRSPALQRCPP